MNHTKTLVAGIATALSLGYGASALAVTADNTVHAESILNLTGFKFAVGNGSAGSGTAINYCLGAATAGCAMQIVSGTSTGDTTSTVIGLGADTHGFSGSLQQNFMASSTVGSATYGASGLTKTTGDALDIVTGDNIEVYAKTLLDASGKSSSSANQNLQSVSFTILAAKSFTAEVSFDAELILAAGIGGPNYNGSALAAVSWNMTIEDIGADELLSWTPSASGGVATGLTAASLWQAQNFSDAKSLNKSISTSFFLPDRTFGFTTGHFEIEAFLSEGHFYNLSLTQTNNVTAEQVVPEPTTLALLGLGMLGMGAARRRKA